MLKDVITKKVKKVLIFIRVKYINAILSRKLDDIGPQSFDIKNSYYTFT